MRSKPETIANVSIKEHSFSKKQIQGVVEASHLNGLLHGPFIKVY